MGKTWHEVTVSVGDISHDSVESRIVTNRVSIGEMKEPDPRSHGVVPPQWDRHTRTKIEAHVQPARVGERSIVSETHKSAVDGEKGLVAPPHPRYKLQPDGSAAAVRVFAASRYTSRVNDKRFDIQIAGDE